MADPDLLDLAKKAAESLSDVDTHGIDRAVEAAILRLRDAGKVDEDDFCRFLKMVDDAILEEETEAAVIRTIVVVLTAIAKWGPMWMV